MSLNMKYFRKRYKSKLEFEMRFSEINFVLEKKKKEMKKKKFDRDYHCM